MSGLVTLYTTCADSAHAEALANRLLDERLIACANIIPGAISLYTWEGQRKRDQEVVVLMKTTASLADMVIARAKALHGYDVPALLAWPVQTADPAYVRWVKDNSR
jgi:periplasmic divalent cation tolerance protein